MFTTKVMPNLKLIQYNEFLKNSNKMLFFETGVIKYNHVASDLSTLLITSFFYKNINFPIKDFMIKRVWKSCHLHCLLILQGIKQLHRGRVILYLSL